MSSGACCPARNASAYECHWNCDHAFKCDLTVQANVPTRRKREFTPDELKDDNYWMKRSRNNEAAKRSRERRRMEERLLEERALQLLRENEKLKAALSALSCHGVGKETYDTFMDFSPARELSRDSYLRSLVNFPGANRIPHYALSSRCDFSPAYDSVPLPRTPSFPAAASFTAVDNTHRRDRYLGVHAPCDGNVPPSAYSNLPYAITQRKWGQGHAHPAMNFYPNSAPFPLNEIVPGYRCASGSAPQTRVNETYVEQRQSVIEPKDICKEMEIKVPKRVSTSPLLPHKLRYKGNKVRRGGAPGISHYIQE